MCVPPPTDERGRRQRGGRAITGRILTLRGQRVIPDADLAALYGVPAKLEVKLVKDRNLKQGKMQDRLTGRIRIV